MKKTGDRPSEDDFSEMEKNAAFALQAYHADLKARDRKIPGDDADWDAQYAEWLREKSSWLPLRLIREGDVSELDRMGLLESKVVAFRKAFEAVLDAEKAEPARARPADAARSPGRRRPASWARSRASRT